MENTYTGSDIETIPYTQNEIEEEVKKILLDKGMNDILYPGSNISQISDVMTYLIHVLNTNTAINLQEVLLPLASKRMNVLFGARQLGYEPKQKISYVYILTLLAKKNPNFGMNPGESGYTDKYLYQIPKYTKFGSEDKTYYFFGERTNIELSNEDIDNSVGSYKMNIAVKEGKFTHFSDNELLRQRAFNIVNDEGNIEVKQNYVIPFSDIEEEGMEIFLTYIDENNIEHIREKWDRSDYFLIDDSYEVDRNKYVRLQNIFMNMPEIFFEVGGIGPRIRLNTLIETNILQSSGSNGAAGESFEILDFDVSEQFSINSFYLYQDGFDEESLKGIKENAPIFHNSANRLVTANDYVAMTRRHEKVDKAICWGSEDETGRDLGLAYLSMTPEKLIKSFLSVTDTENDGNPVNDNDFDTSNTFFVLQKTPRHPFIQGTISDYSNPWDLGDDDDNGSSGDTPMPDKTTSNIGDSWSVTFNDTNNDGTMDIFGGDLHNQSVYLNDVISLVKDEGNPDGTGKRFVIGLDANIRLKNWYLDKDLDILDSNITLDENILGNYIPDKIFSYLKPYQIMSIKSYFRQPVYCDFDFKVNLIQNNLALAEKDINQEVFNIIKSYFDKEVEDFDNNFLLSVLISKINEYTSDIRGVNINFTNSLVYHRTMFDYKLSEFNPNNHTIFTSLALPFERIYDLNNNLELDTKYLPQISCSYYDLFVDFNNFWTGNGTNTPTSHSKVIGCPIHHGTDNTGDIVGYYFIRNDYQMNIEIQLYFSENGSDITQSDDKINEFIDLTLNPLTANIKEMDFFTDEQFGYLDLVYPGLETSDWQNITKGVNLPFTGYTLPRLHSVKFLKN